MGNPYQLYEEDELSSLVTTLKTRKLSILAGKEFQDGNMGGKSFHRATLEISEIDKQLQQIAEVLNSLNPTDYPLLSIPDRASANFSTWRFL